MKFANKLTAIAVKNAKSDGTKIRRLFDGEGLYLEISKENNRKGWRFKYRFAGREKRISLGVYPDVSLEQARERKRQARELLTNGIDPGKQRKIDKLQKTSKPTFEAVAEEFFNIRKSEWSKGHRERVSNILKRKLNPWIGKTPIDEITAPILLKALRKTESEGKYESTKKAKQIAGQVLNYGIVTGVVEHNFIPSLRGVLTKAKTKHMAAIIDPEGVGKLMLAIDSYEGSPEVCCALRLLPLVFVRTGELRHAEWSEIDLERKLWTISAEKIKNEKIKSNQDLMVPLSRQALKILRCIQDFTGDYRYVFPGARSTSRPMSENAVLVALRSMGYTKEQMTGHGFRAMAKTLLEEELEFNTKWIEMQLAHKVKDPLGTAYNRAKYLKQRTKMMQAWADYLDDLKEKAKARASG